MTPTTRIRLSRTLRFGLFGCVLGAIVYALLVFIIAVVAALNGELHAPDLSVIVDMARWGIIWSGIPGVLCAALGAATATIEARITGWRFLGIVLIVISGVFLWWALSAYDAADTIERCFLIGVPAFFAIIGIAIIVLSRRLAAQSA